MIYIYKKNNLVEVLNYDIKEFKKEWYPNFEKDMEIYDKKFEYPIYEKGTLREMTREELVANGIEIVLENGEIVKNKKLIKIPQPSEYHKWLDSKWVVDLEEVKEIKREELKIKRDEVIKSDLEVNRDLFQVRNSEDRDKFNRILLGLLLGKLNKEDEEEWRLANNTYKSFTYSKLSEIPELYSNRERETFKKFHELENKLEACKTVEEIEAIKWEE